MMLTLALLAVQALTIAPVDGDRIQLEVYKTGLLNGKKHVFLFTQYKGKLDYDAEAPVQSRIELTIQAASAQCQDTWVNPKDLKKIQEFALNDMLAAAQHPAITFRSSKVAPKSNEVFEVHGALTIRGIAKPVVVTVTRKPGGKFEGTAIVKHTDFGLKPSKAALGTIGTKDEMTLSFVLTPR
jgi:polyisoprenoid-binding protein YceI